jgi:DNA-binding NtrC family response regulator
MPQVLLVDDDKECLNALSNRLRFAFRRHALRVDIADCAATGLILAHQGEYDALLIDVLMPGINGIKFVEQLRRSQPDVPIVMMSGWEVAKCEEHAARLGLIACLPKPIEFGALVGLLAELLDLANQSSSFQRAAFANHQATNTLEPRVNKTFRNKRSHVYYASLNVDDQRFHTS